MLFFQNKVHLSFASKFVPQRLWEKPEQRKVLMPSKLYEHFSSSEHSSPAVRLQLTEEHCTHCATLINFLP